MKVVYGIPEYETYAEALSSVRLNEYIAAPCKLCEEDDVITMMEGEFHEDWVCTSCENKRRLKTFKTLTQTALAIKPQLLDLGLHGGSKVQAFLEALDQAEKIR